MDSEYSDLEVFSLSTWQPEFGFLTPETHVIEIPKTVMKLLTNGVYELESLNVVPGLKEFCEKLMKAILHCGGCGFVKNNWHAPKDAKFMSLSSELKVQTPKDVILFLSASDISTTDFTSACEVPFVVVIKQWLILHPASEFRCIVVNDVLRGITPRDWPMFYKHYLSSGSEIIEDIRMFFKFHIQTKFPRRNYTFDVIIQYPRTVMLIDFNPLYECSELYAFSWKEIKTIMDKNCGKDVDPVFRYLEQEISIMSRSQVMHSMQAGYPDFEEKE